MRRRVIEENKKKSGLSHFSLWLGGRNGEIWVGEDLEKKSKSAIYFPTFTISKVTFNFQWNVGAIHRKFSAIIFLAKTA
jgi:hypothetical protein